MGSSPSYTPLDPNSLGADALRAQLELAPQQYAAEKQYRPQYTELDNATLRDSLEGTMDMGSFLASNPGVQQQIEAERANGGLTGWSDAEIIKAYAPPGTDPNSYRRGGMIDTLGRSSTQLGGIQSAANTQQRTADVADVEALGGRSNAAFRAANPQLTGLLDDQAAAARAGNAPSALEQELTRQAQSDLAMGGQLNPAQQAMIEQQSRAAFGARGLGRSQQAAIGEAFNALDYSRGLQAERRGFAGAANTGNMQRQQLGSSLLGGAVASQSANSIDPFMSILGRSSGASGQAQGLIGGSGNTGGPQIFNPFSSDIMSIYAGNQQGQSAAQSAAAGSQGQMIGGGLAAAGTIAAVMI
jgi:hypothetical protein